MLISLYFIVLFMWQCNFNIVGCFESTKITSHLFESSFAGFALFWLENRIIKIMKGYQ